MFKLVNAYVAKSAKHEFKVKERAKKRNEQKHVTDISIFTLANIASTPRKRRPKKQIVVVVVFIFDDEISNGNQKRASFFFWFVSLCVKIAIVCSSSKFSREINKKQQNMKRVFYHCLCIILLLLLYAQAHATQVDTVFFTAYVCVWVCVGSILIWIHVKRCAMHYICRSWEK